MDEFGGRKCSSCGARPAASSLFYNIHLGAYVCVACASKDHPSESRQELERLVADPVFLAMSWNVYCQRTVPHFAYLNDEKMPAFINERHIRDFVGDLSLRRPIEALMKMWREVGLVHGSLTSLSHARDNPIQIEWGPRATDGVIDHHSFARSFNDGIQYPNISMAGLRDFAHVEQVAKPDVEDPERTLKSLLTVPGDLLTLRQGYGVLCRSIAEVLIVAIHGAILKGVRFRELIGPIIIESLSSLLEPPRYFPEDLLEAWEGEKLHRMVRDVDDAIASDTLRLSRLVRAAELFVLALEGPNAADGDEL